MHTLIQDTAPWRLVVVKAPSFVLSLVIAELFFKFQSFTLECLAFLITWGVLSRLAGWIRAELGRSNTDNP